MTALKMKHSKALDIYSASSASELSLPIAQGGISAGFPSPAMDFMDVTIDLNKHLIKHPSTTFYGLVKGNSMQGAGIFDGDILVIDKSLTPKNNDIAVCYIDGEFTVKRIQIEKDCIWLVPENNQYKPIQVNEDNNFLIWGIVTFTIKQMN